MSLLSLTDAAILQCQANLTIINTASQIKRTVRPPNNTLQHRTKVGAHCHPSFKVGGPLLHPHFPCLWLYLYHTSALLCWCAIQICWSHMFADWVMNYQVTTGGGEECWLCCCRSKLRNGAVS